MKIKWMIMVWILATGFMAKADYAKDATTAYWYDLIYSEYVNIETLRNSKEASFREMVESIIKVREGLQKKNRELVKQCLSEVETGKTVGVSAFFLDKCNDSRTILTGKYNGGDKIYQLKKSENGKLSISFQINAQITPFNISRNRKVEIMSKTRQCLAQVKPVWDRYGIDLNIDIKFYENRMNGPAQQMVFISDKVGRSNAQEWMFKGQGGNTPDEYCKTILHETGHLMGLPDTYSENSKCPNREVVRSETQIPPDVMDNVFKNGAEIYPEHIAKIIGPLCPNITSTQSDNTESNSVK